MNEQYRFVMTWRTRKTTECRCLAERVTSRWEEVVEAVLRMANLFHFFS